MGQTERNTAHFRQVCSLHLPLESLVTALSEALRPMLGMHCMLFSLATPDGKTSRVWMDRPMPMAVHDDYMRNYTDRPRQALRVGQDVALRLYHGVRALPDWPQFHQSDFYHAIWKPLGLHAALTMFLREPARSVALGSCLVYRAPGERPFSPADLRSYESVLPFMTHAFGSVKGHDKSTQWADSGEYGLVLMDHANHLHMDASTQGLLAQLGDLWVSTRTDEALLLRTVAQRLRDVFAHRDSSPPVAFFVTRWGRFTLRASWIGKDGLIGITVTKQEPMLLHMVRKMRTLPLSPAQRRVCLMAANRRSNIEIASALDITIHTVHDQMAAVYGALGVADRAALADLLKAPYEN